MKVKHTKLKKSIFLILICISLTTTFVLSTSAAWSDSGYTYSFYVDDELVRSSPIYYDSNDPLGFQFYIINIPSGIVDIPFSPGFYFISLYDFENSDSPSPIFLGSSFDISNLSVLDSSSVALNVNYWGDQDVYGAIFSVYAFLCTSDITFLYNTSSSPSFTDTVGSGLTSSLSWVGQVVESLTTGPIRPLLECFAVTISVSALLLGIYSIRRLIWGS